MKAFRLLALGYVITALLIAPAWLAADEPAVPTVPEAVEDPTGTVNDIIDAARGETGAPTEPAAKTPVVKAQEENDDAKARERQATGAKQKQRAQKRDTRIAKAAQSNSVTITDFEFNPARITVNVGDTVTWTNEGPTDHTATAEDGSFDTGNLEQGESGSATFNQAGTIAYICTPHPFMKGEVVVRAAGSGDGGGGGGGSTGDGGGSTGDGTDTTDASDDGSGTAGVDATSGGTGGSSLASTGFELLIIALLGLGTLGAGIVLRARTEA